MGKKQEVSIQVQILSQTDEKVTFKMWPIEGGEPKEYTMDTEKFEALNAEFGIVPIPIH